MAELKFWKTARAKKWWAWASDFDTASSYYKMLPEGLRDAIHRYFWLAAIGAATSLLAWGLATMSALPPIATFLAILGTIALTVLTVAATASLIRGGRPIVINNTVESSAVAGVTTRNDTPSIFEIVGDIRFERLPYSAVANNWGNTRWMCKTHTDVELLVMRHKQEFVKIPNHRGGGTYGDTDIKEVWCASTEAGSSHWIGGGGESLWLSKNEADARLDAQALLRRREAALGPTQR